MRIARFSKKDKKWIAYSSTIPENEDYIYSYIDNFGIYSLSCYAGAEVDYDADGEVKGSSVGIYPNGTLLKSVDSNDVWYIQANKRSLVNGLIAFESRFEYSDIILLPSNSQIELYQIGETVSIAPGTLLKERNSSKVYRFSANGGLQEFDSYSTLLKRGYNVLDITEVEPGELSGYSFESFISNPKALYTGDLVKLSGRNTVYYVDQSVLRPIFSWEVFEERLFRHGMIMTVSNEVFNTFSIGPVIYHPDGTLIKGPTSTSVYVISDGARRPIRSWVDFNGMFYDWRNILTVSNTVLSNIPVGRMVQLVE